ncbi:hypothetical protein RCZ01_12750 [Capnocytophaga felis]|uniref:Uncharacterized protein n=1 Tax=Capnocytophaga felis TaxID=2267611 RepID=A0A5M4B8N6_9FLAO|nr:hypothetical protein RCZ01_12750 [Capnocytophaga felis]GET49175.1 hypothetical protein RCZ02_20060 [Capnocytophaga felis]
MNMTFLRNKMRISKKTKHLLSYSFGYFNIKSMNKISMSLRKRLDFDNEKLNSKVKNIWKRTTIDL